jgi:hypothetical protein
MSSVDPMRYVDLDTGFIWDPKIRNLFRKYPLVGLQAAWSYVALLTESWSRGERLTLYEAWYPYLSDDKTLQEDVANALRASRLIDDEARIPHETWVRWYVSKWQARQAATKHGRAGARGRWAPRSLPDGEVEVNGQKVTPAEGSFRDKVPDPRTTK